MAERPLHPRMALVASILPGAGHVAQGRPTRGLSFLFFMAVFGWLSVKLMPEHASFIGRHIGGIFIYGLSILDAYRFSRVKWEEWKHAENS